MIPRVVTEVHVLGKRVVTEVHVLGKTMFVILLFLFYKF